MNEQEKILKATVTVGNVDDCVPVPELVKNLFGKIFGDRKKKICVE